MKLLPALFVCLLLAGCATPGQKFSALRLGMSKAEAIAVMGRADRVSAQGATEYLLYNPPLGELREYYVRFVDGRLESFGQNGDFNSTRPPTIRVETR